MKHCISRSGLRAFLLVVLLCSAALSKSYAQVAPPDAAPPTASGNITYQTFYDDLAPYGSWLDYPAYGSVWSPRVDEDFRPYATNGYWDYATDGWTWMSNYPWGWAPFHYGRWIYDNTYGWLWVPGYEWSPAWVTWGDYDNYYCWAPLMPDVNVGIAFGGWRPHDFYWNAVPRGNIYDHNLGAALVRPGTINRISRHVNIINNFNTTNGHNQYYSRGPAVGDVEKFTNRKIAPSTIVPVNSAAQVKHEGNQMKVYKPQVQNPQPREFRQVQVPEAKPVRTDDEWPNAERNTQRNNIEQLPVMHTSPSDMGRGGGFGRGGGGRH
ncbi:DUF6600 domain-containing protein [Chitinophaga sp. 30R24]|uniref:DUF6600 domain-containing protein n=1 Tax=Chitinophaga sp. 30R24 TaxID=3248838 RepID=UPI003B90E80E